MSIIAYSFLINHFKSYYSNLNSKVLKPFFFTLEYKLKYMIMNVSLMFEYYQCMLVSKMLLIWNNYTKNPDLSLFCKKMTKLFISTKLDPDILISYKLVPA